MFRVTACSVLIAALLACGVASADVTLIENGEARVKVYVHPAELQPVERIRFYRPKQQPSEIGLAIDDLQTHLARMSGAEVQVVATDDAMAIPSPAVVVGKLAVDLGGTIEPTAWREGYRLVTRDGRLLVFGERDVATSYAVYALLYELGCDWVMPGELGAVIPQRQTVTVPATLDKMVQPAYALRHIWIGGGQRFHPGELVPEFHAWIRRQRFGMAEQYRERISEAHMWQKLVATYKDEFKQNPDMLALVREPDGSFVRRGPQIETENPQTVRLAARFIRETFEARGWPTDKRITLPIGPADGLGYSESPESLAARVDRQHPISGGEDYTDLVVKFADAVLRELGDDYANLSLGYYCYSVHNQFPKRVDLNPRVLPILAPISYSRYHSTIDPHSKTRAYYRAIVERYADWSQRTGSPLMVYEYNWNLADNLLPYTRVRSIAEDTRYYHEKGVIGWNQQAERVWSTAAAHNYIHARMLWDPSLDWRELLTEFCDKAYGPAAQPMEAYTLRMAERQSSAGEEAGSYYAAKMIFDDDFIAASRADFNSALAAPGLSALQRKRVRASEFSFHMLELYMQWERASQAFDFAEASRIGERMRATYDAALEMSMHLYGRASGIYLDRLLRNSTKGQLTYSSEPYRMIHKLPDALATMFDPTSSGEAMNLFSPHINGGGWVKTKTYSSTWDAQGLGLLRDGSVWYRTHFEAPADAKDQGLGLLLGAFEDEPRVWVNGAYMGSTGIVFPQPAAIDLTDAVRFGEENLLVIEIRRNSKANELLLGGILRPSYIFTGPRVETPKPSPHRVRVLPGGEIEIIKDEDTP